MENKRVFGIHMEDKNSAHSETRPHICIGWPSLGNITEIRTKDALAKLYEEKYPGKSKGHVSQNVGQIWRFINEASVGDYVLHRLGNIVYIGEITSDYFYDPNMPGQTPDYPNNRNVRWIKKIHKAVMSQGLLNSSGSAMSFFSLNPFAKEINSFLNDEYLNNIPVYLSLKQQPDIDADTYDGSYQLTRSIVEAFRGLDLSTINHTDLETVYLATVGTWKNSFAKKKEKIASSHLPPERITELQELVDRLEQKTINGEFSHTEHMAKAEMGMFGMAKSTLYSVKDEEAQAAIRTFLDVLAAKSEEEAYDFVSRLASLGIKDFQAGKLSTILHCLKPEWFPIINGNQGIGSDIFEILSIPVENTARASTYIDNCREIAQFRNAHFAFKNYRVLDLASFALKTPAEGLEDGDPHLASIDETAIQIEASPNSKQKSNESYSKEDFLKEVFVEEGFFDKTSSVLKMKKNIILQGPPGVGKTFAAKRLCYALMGEKDDERIRMVQFHQSYSYEDFVQGYKPTKQGGFGLRDGVFYEFCELARQNSGQDFYFIIDEINRGNISKIFGELLMLIEKSHRGETVPLAYSSNGKPFSVPENLYLIGMMNTADRSLALLDYALRRRFAFITMEPAFETENKVFEARIKESRSEKLVRLINEIKSLNEIIAKDPSLGKGFKIGHSYFVDPGLSQDDKLVSVVEFEIIPMIEEYFVDDEKKLREWTDRLLRVFE